MAQNLNLRLSVAPGGWVQATWRPNRRAWLRFEPDANGVPRVIELRVAHPTPELLRAIPLRRIETALKADTALLLAFAVTWKEVPPDNLEGAFRHSVPERKRYRLQRPKGRRLDNSFYEKVARAYRDALIFGLNPRKTLADDTGAALDTVAGWIAKARRLEREGLDDAPKAGVAGEDRDIRTIETEADDARWA
jgi:hypothetical protein